MKRIVIIGFIKKTEHLHLLPSMSLFEKIVWFRYSSSLFEKIMRFHSIKSYYGTPLFVQIMRLNIEISLFCKIMRLEGAGGDTHKHI